MATLVVGDAQVVADADGRQRWSAPEVVYGSRHRCRWSAAVVVVKGGRRRRGPRRWSAAVVEASIAIAVIRDVGNGGSESVSWRNDLRNVTSPVASEIHFPKP
ncbi:hypothetical protein OSB04_007830 [Centaurea solstitialis]|uniref:Uncharacterized protein n=1 Tax=Centaurea solstitialis TaxID=347529 RepID=A0AA38WR28_9ASTR|nr:hypothetical protein OSB04_007830 [Centaurea solstitialis]